MMPKGMQGNSYTTCSSLHQAALALAVMTCLWLTSHYSHWHTKAELLASAQSRQQQQERLYQLRAADEEMLQQMRVANERLLTTLQQGPGARQNASGTKAGRATKYEDVAPDFMQGAARQLQTQCDCWSHWRIQGDGCHVSPTDDHCIQTTNYPGNYLADESCTIEIVENPDFWIVIEDLKAEYGWDYLQIDGVQYRVTAPPRQFRPTAGASISWATNWAVHRRGWKMCRRSSCEGYVCGANHVLKPSAELIVCGKDVCSDEDLLTCCDPLCDAPQNLGPEYMVSSNCTPGSVHSVLECPVTCAGETVLDGHSSPQKCLDDGTFAVPTCVTSNSGATDFPWVAHGQCQHYGPSCVSSNGVGGRYGLEETCLVAVDWESLPLETSRYQMLATYMDTERDVDRLILGVKLEATSCDSGSWTCHHGSNESDIPTYAWSTWMTRVSGTNTPQGPYGLDNVLWTSDSATAGTGWILCVQTTCLAMSCPAGYRFRCQSEDEWCKSHDCSLDVDVDLCCVPETQQDADLLGFELGQAHNISWCWAVSTTTTTTTTTLWVAKPDIVGHLILQLPAIDAERDENQTAEAVAMLKEELHATLVQLAGVGHYDVQVGLNMSSGREPVSHLAFRVEQTDVPLEQFNDTDYVAAFNNETTVVEAITHRVVTSSTMTLWGDHHREFRGYNSHCQDLHPCDETCRSVWTEDYSWQNCAMANHKKLCGPEMTPGPGWLGLFGDNLPSSYEYWATVLAVPHPNWGLESIIDECCACGGGRCSSGYFRIFDDTPTFCIACPPGSTSNVADDPRECTLCEPGTFSAAQASAQCSSCPPGHYTSEHGLSECSVCDPGTASSLTGVTACEACPPGQAPSSDHLECIPCAIGTFAGFNATPECEPCPAGQFSDEVGVSECDQCDIGMFTGGAGRTDCDPCGVGTYSDTLGLSACYDCPPGEAQALVQQTACVECDAGYHAGIPGLSECLLCGAGTESLEPGAAECTQCDPGFAKAAGAFNCSACEPGTHTAEPGLSACRVCPELGQRTNAPAAADGCVDCETGRYGPTVGLTSCIDCALGLYGAQEKMSACVECEAGRFSNETGFSECLQCSPGSFSAVEGQFMCELCSPGLDAPSEGSVECTVCQAGKHAPSKGTVVCADCEAGLYSPLQGSTACFSCQLGRFASEPGMPECAQCEPGFYADAEGSTVCTGCNPLQQDYWTTMRPPTDADPVRPSGIKPWVELRGASSAESCGCRPGAQLEGTLSTCEDCGEGLICLGMGVLEIEEGYSWDGKYSTWNCKHGEEDACPGGMPGTCKPGRDKQKIACAACLPDLVEAEDGSCTECGGGELALPIFVALLALASVTAMYYIFDSPKQKRPKLSYLLIVASLGQAVTIVQQLGVISLIRIDWAEPLLGVLQFVGTLAFFDLQDIRSGCLLSLDILGQYVLRVITVFIALIVVCVAHFISQLVQHRHDWNSRWPSLWCALGTILLACMVSIVSTMLSPLQCRRHPNGRQTISWYPSIACWEGGDHTQMVSLGSAACLLPVIFLAGSCWAVWCYPKRLMQANTSFLNAWAFLFFRYSPESYWYGPVMMVRNCLIAAAPVLTSPVLQIVALEVVMVFSMVLLLYIMPWRVAKANDLDAAGHICLLVVTMMAAFFVGEENLDVVSIFAVVLISVMPFLLVVLIGYGFMVVLRSTRRQFQFFLCHHKQGAGCFCRLLKMWLLKTSGVKRKVFIDSDDLKNLDRLFDVVAHQTDTLVAVNSQNLLQRPWCVGEITTAHRSRVRIMPLYVAGVSPPSDDFIKNFLTYVPDVSSITQFGIEIQMVQEALESFAAINVCHLPQEITDRTLEALCSGLVSTKLPEELPSKQAKSPSPPEVVIIANKMDFEAAATAMILRNLLNPLIQHQDNCLSYVLGMDEVVSHNAKKGMLICSNGMFTDQILRALLACKARSAVMLPIMSVTNFIIPSREWMERQDAFGKFQPGDQEEAYNVVLGVFSEIAVDFQPSALSGTEATLQTKAVEIANRLLGGMTSLSDKVSVRGKRSKNGRDSSTQMGITQTQSQNSAAQSTSHTPSHNSGGPIRDSLKPNQEIEIFDPEWELGAHAQLPASS